MMKIAVSISLSIPDDDHKASLYVEGFKRNAASFRDFYPEADLILHHDDTVSEEIVGLAQKKVRWSRNEGTTCMFWRFSSVGDEDYDAVLVRDADSVPNKREADAVCEWLCSGLPIHTMHDHPAHAEYRVMGGMWGARKNAFPYDFSHLVKWWITHKQPFKYNSDQWFLMRYVYPYAERYGMNHAGIQTKFLNRRMFPGGPSPSTGYVGERISIA